MVLALLWLLLLVSAVLQPPTKIGLVRWLAMLVLLHVLLDNKGTLPAALLITPFVLTARPISTKPRLMALVVWRVPRCALLVNNATLCAVFRTTQLASLVELVNLRRQPMVLPVCRAKPAVLLVLNVWGPVHQPRTLLVRHAQPRLSKLPPTPRCACPVIQTAVLEII